MRVRLHRHPLGAAAVSLVITGYIRAARATGKFQLRCDPQAAELIRARTPVIGAFWHGRMMMIQPAWASLVRHLTLTSPLRPWVVTSSHADGRLIATVCERLGLGVVSGSTKRAGGLGLLRAGFEVLKSGEILVITPDGPRGPRRRAKNGTVHLAMRAAVPIIPVTFASRRQWVLSSWDCLVMPSIFDHGILAFGQPLRFGKETEISVAPSELERALNGLTDEVERVAAGGSSSYLQTLSSLARHDRAGRG